MKFTVIIPTRERCDTLYYTIKTCVEQEYDNLSIIISDNCSEDKTRDVVESFADSRIKYINPGKRLGMSSHWEFALSHVEDGYFTFVGDDDGLLPEAIKNVAEIIDITKTSALAWLKVEYHWPSHLTQENNLKIPMLNRIECTSATKLLNDMISGWMSYSRGPTVYNSFVDFDVVRRIKSRTGDFFKSVTPDVYSAFALLSEISSFIHSTRPFSVNGASKHSGGCAEGLSQNKRNQGMKSQYAFLNEADLPIHAGMDVIPGSMTSAIVESMLQVNDHCYEGKLKISLKKLMPKIFRELSLREPEVYNLGMKQLDELTERLNMQKYALQCKRRFPNRQKEKTWKAGMDDRYYLTVDPSELGVTDVCGAALLVQKLLGSYILPSKFRSYSHYNKYFRYLCRCLNRFINA